MPKLVPISAKKMIKILKKKGFLVLRQKGRVAYQFMSPNTFL